MKTFKCSVCGYIHRGDAAPEKCPNCGSLKEKFTEVAETQSKMHVFYGEKVSYTDKIEINPFFEDYESLAPFIYNLPVGKKAPLHKHPTSDEFFLVMRGKIKFRIGDEYFILREGDMIRANMNTPHNFENISDEPAFFLSVKGPKPVTTEKLE